MKAAEERDLLAKRERVQQSMNRGKFMTDAPTSKGELVTGGYDSTEIEIVAAARILASKK
jgi:hypothetical protein